VAVVLNRFAFGTILLLSACALPVSPESGKGTETDPRGSTYVGSFKDHKFQGQGTIYIPNGTKIVGNFDNGKLMNGIMYSSNGTKFEGSFQDFLPDTGKFIIDKGVIEGKFFHGYASDGINDNIIVMNGTYSVKFPDGDKCNVTVKNLPLDNADGHELPDCDHN
jgi:hypothetical protein